MPDISEFKIGTRWRLRGYPIVAVATDEGLTCCSPLPTGCEFLQKIAFGFIVPSAWELDEDPFVTFVRETLEEHNVQSGG